MAEDFSDSFDDEDPDFEAAAESFADADDAEVKTEAGE
jgi:hypothetical protein